MGKKKETKNKSKDSGRVQDQNMANAFEYEIALQVQEPNEETCEEPSSVPENGKNVSKGKKLSQYKALVEFRSRVEESILGNYLLGKPSSEVSREENAAIEELKEIKLWGVPLLPSKRHEGTDSVVEILESQRLQDLRFEALIGADHKGTSFCFSKILEVVTRSLFRVHPSKSQTENGRVVIARPGKVTSTLLKFIPPENLPVEYGGLKRENDGEFSTEDKALVVKAKANTTEHIQIPTTKAGMTMIWDLTVVGAWDVSYKEEFIPDDEGSYRVLIQNEKDKKKGGSVRNSFYISEPGKIVISIANFLLKKKKIPYRYKTKPTFPVYAMIKK
ncbi:hypothetical protein F3Y22_tig00111309pilonHSYRG00142 [Hibiscus syriacus]|uniref:Patellin-1-6 C-terminal GOLD domain-containing protein n=1 Tax=Hibiscus syriacus TaxID=106335 RepID=A0A6A2YQX1_HIBSY|nr:hypothetical protein F3Y22_tig00111309pilonHSYRG00142 [Hibiscus syriacus]